MLRSYQRHRVKRETRKLIEESLLDGLDSNKDSLLNFYLQETAEKIIKYLSVGDSLVPLLSKTYLLAIKNKEGNVDRIYKGNWKVMEYKGGRISLN